MSQASVNAENPWPGLLSFTEADKRWFRGREAETEELSRVVKAERLTVVSAVSGIGKSSLLQAGLFPTIRKDDIVPIYIRLDYSTPSPDLRGQVFAAIASAAQFAGFTAPNPKSGQSLWEYFYDVRTEFRDSNENPVLPVLVFDQFEEIFTLGKGEQQQASSTAFLEELSYLADGTVPPAIQQRWNRKPEDKESYVGEGQGAYKILISLREDFLAELIDQNRRIGTIDRKNYRLHQLTGTGALAVVSQASDLVDSTVAEQIVRYVAGEKVSLGSRKSPLGDLPVEPALLSVVCRELNNRRRNQSRARITADLLEGEQDNVIADFYEQSLKDIPAPVRAYVEDNLVSVRGARVAAPMENVLAIKGIARESTSSAVDTLVERRLLRKEYSGDNVSLWLTHDLLTGVCAASKKTREEIAEKALRLRETEEARVQLRKSRRQNLIYLAAAVVASVAAVFGFVGQYQASESQKKTEAQTLRAENSATEALQQRTVAEKSATEAVQQRTLADQKAIEAEKAAEEAARQKSAAQVSEANAKASEANANQKAEQARLAQIAADKNAADAILAKSEATAAQQNTLVANTNLQATNKELDSKKKESDLELAKRLVSEAAGLVSSGQTPRALGNLARALTLDPDSRIAKSLAFDQLLRGSNLQGVKPPSGPGLDAFIHPAMAHPAGVLYSAFSPNGTQVATASKDKIIRIWNWRQAELVAQLSGHEKEITFVAFSADGKLLVSASLDQTARIWDLGTRAVIRTVNHASVVKSAVFSPDSARIITASQDKTAQVWNVSTGAKVGEPLKHDMTVNFASFSANGRQAVTACADRKGRVWDLQSGREVFAMPHAGEVRSANFSPDGKLVVTASVDGTAKLWDTATHAVVFDTMQHNGSVYFASFSPDGHRVATASRDGSARVWDAHSGRAITAPLVHQNKSAVISATFSPDGTRLVTSSDDRTAQTWEIWHQFQNSTDLVHLLEGVGRFGTDENVTPLPADQVNRIMTEQRSRTDAFERWFFAHRI